MGHHALPDLPKRLFESLFESLSSRPRRKLVVIILSLNEILSRGGQKDQFPAHPFRPAFSSKIDLRTGQCLAPVRNQPPGAPLPNGAPAAPAGRRGHESRPSSLRKLAPAPNRSAVPNLECP